MPGLFAGAFEERLFEGRTVALADSFIDALGKEAVHCFGVRDGVAREFVAEIVEL